MPGAVRRTLFPDGVPDVRAVALDDADVLGPAVDAVCAMATSALPRPRQPAMATVDKRRWRSKHQDGMAAAPRSAATAIP